MHPRFIMPRGASAALLLLVALASSAQSINTNYLPGTDFSKYRTYRWVVIGEAAQVNQIADQQIKAAVDKQLAAKSFTKTDADPTDLYVGYQVGVRQQQELNAYGAPGWRYGYGYGGGMATVTSSTIDVGTLVLDFYDPATKQLVWRGAASKSLSRSSSAEKKQKNLNKAAAKLLRIFRPALSSKQRSLLRAHNLCCTRRRCSIAHTSR